jgi:hypothetical protein
VTRTEHDRERDREYARKSRATRTDEEREASRTYQREYARERRTRLRELGICIDCRKRMATDGQLSCETCRVHAKTLRDTRAAAATAAGLCLTCCKRVPVEGRRTCAECYSPKPPRPRRIWPHGTYRRYALGCHCPECRAANTERCRETTRRRLATLAPGICTQCCKRPATEGRKRCEACRAYNAEHWRKHEERQQSKTGVLRRLS